MDQIKTALTQVKKFHFWILCGVIAVVGLGSWYMTQASLNKEFETNKTEIEGSFSSATALNSKVNPPNPSVHEAMELRIGDLQKDVMQVWQSQYDHQKNTTLIWPQELTTNFLRAVEPLRPIEEKVPYPTPPEQEIARDLRAEYSNYVEMELPKLAEVIGAQWRATAGAAGGSGGYGAYGSEGAGYGAEATMDYGASGSASAGYGGASYGASSGAGGYGPEGAGTPMKEPVVDWSTGDQSQLMGRFSWPGGAPTTLQLLYAQEDLWVLKNIMEIIKNTNDGATERHKAYIKKIDSIQIGRAATGRTGQITPVVAAAAQAGYGAEGMYPSYGAGGSSGSAEGSGGVPSSETMGETGSNYGSTEGGSGYGMTGGGSADPAERRYVDKDYKPLTGEKLRSDVTSNAAEVYLAVAKRMPVRLVCQIDQRKIHKLLAECGNSPLTVEVRQVRIGGNAGKGGASGGYGGSMGGMSTFAGSSSEASYGGMSMGGMTMGSYGSEGDSASAGYGSSGYGGATQSGANTNDITVEIYGIVYIYNPVNRKALGLPEGEDPSAGAEAVTADAAASRSPS
jgi:hypothetical protein